MLYFSHINSTRSQNLSERQKIKFLRDSIEFIYPSLPSDEKKTTVLLLKRRRQKVLHPQIFCSILKKQKLKKAETFLLSLPSTCPIDETRLSEDLHYFVKNFRIKEYLESKKSYSGSLEDVSQS